MNRLHSPRPPQAAVSLLASWQYNNYSYAERADLIRGKLIYLDGSSTNRLMARTVEQAVALLS